MRGAVTAREQRVRTKTSPPSPTSPTLSKMIFNRRVRDEFDCSIARDPQHICHLYHSMFSTSVFSSCGSGSAQHENQPINVCTPASW